MGKHERLRRRRRTPSVVVSAAALIAGLAVVAPPPAGAGSSTTVLGVDVWNNAVSGSGFGGPITVSFDDGTATAPCPATVIADDADYIGIDGCDILPDWLVTGTAGSESATVRVEDMSVNGTTDALVSVTLIDGPSAATVGCGGPAFVMLSSGELRWLSSFGTSTLDFSSPGSCGAHPEDDTTATIDESTEFFFFVNDTDGETTPDENRVAVQADFPRFAASITSDWVQTDSYAPGASVTVEVIDGSPPAEFSDTYIVPPEGFLFVDLAGAVDLSSGKTVTVTGSSDPFARTKSLELATVTYDSLDPATDVGSGTAPAGAPDLFVNLDPDLGPCGGPAPVVSGIWSVDFATTCGSGSVSDTSFSQAFLEDGDSDATVVEFFPPPFFTVLRDTDQMDGTNWSPDASVSVEVFDVMGGSSVFFSSVPVEPDGTFAAGFFEEFDFVVGNHVVVTDDATGVVKDTVIASHTFDLLSNAPDLATGTAPAGALLEIAMGSPAGDCGTGASVPETGGVWTLDFVGPDAFGCDGFLVTPSTSGVAYLSDGDGDATGAEPVRRITAIPDFEEIHGEGWFGEATVTVDVLDAPAGSSLLLSPLVVPVDPLGFFGVGLFGAGPGGGDVDLGGGNHVVVTGVSGTRELTVAEVSVSLDDALDEASGTAPAAAEEVEVGLGDAFENGCFNVVVPVAGGWSMDLVGAENGECDGFDITSITNGDATVRDADGDATTSAAPAPGPSVRAVLETAVENAKLKYWMPGTSVDVTLYSDDSRSLALDGPISVPIGADTKGVVSLSVIPIPGNELVASYGPVEKALVIEPLDLGRIGLGDDTVRGTAAPDDDVAIVVGDADINGEAPGTRFGAADPSGDWAFDLTVGSPVVDIAATDEILVATGDEDGDWTAIEHYGPTPRVTLSSLGAVTEGDSGSSVLMAFAATADTVPTKDVIVHWETVDLPIPGFADSTEGDYTPATGTTTIPAGSGSAVFFVTVDGDDLDEDDEFLLVRTVDVENAAIGGFYGFGFGVIVDDESPPAVIPGAAPAVSEGGPGESVTVSIPLVLSHPSSKTVSVTVSTVDATAPGFASSSGGDFVAVSGTVDFDPFVTEVMFDVVITGDAVLESDEILVVSTSGHVNSVPGGIFGLGFAGILDDD